jgi:hypothetical protein
MQVPVMANIIRRLEASKVVYTIRINQGGTDEYDPTTHTISWDPLRGLRCTTGGTQSPALGLGHELTHALGPMAPWAYAPHDYDTVEERRVITGAERTAASALGECVRNNHRGALFNVSNPTMH